MPAALLVCSQPKPAAVDVPKIMAQFTYKHVDGTNDLEQAGFFGLKTDDNLSDHAIKQIVLDCLKDAPGISQSALVKAVKAQYLEDEKQPGIHRIRGIIQTMVGNGEIAQTGNDQGREGGQSAGYELPKQQDELF